MDILFRKFARYLKFKLKVNIINYMAFIIIPFLNTFTAVLSVFLNTFLFRFLVFVNRICSFFNNVLGLVWKFKMI